MTAKKECHCGSMGGPLASHQQAIGVGLDPCQAFRESVKTKRDIAFDALVEAAREALSVCYGAKQCLGDIANISHAIKLLETALAQATEGK